MERAIQVKLKPVPIIKMLGVATVVTLSIMLIDATLRSFPNHETLTEEYSWFVADLVHIPQFLIPFLLICYLTKGKVGEYGFNVREGPPFFTHRHMLGLGVFAGLLLSLRYISQVVGKIPLDIPQPVTWVSVIGNMTFQWVVVGLCEETMFRGLIQTYLMNNLGGYVKVAGHDLHVGTVIGAVFWGGFHFIKILYMPLGSVLFFVLLTTVIGLLVGYAYQETGSLLTTMIVHNTLFGVSLTIGYMLYWML
jgi:membrane protease YdiL (CAAX protease family)